MRPVVLAVLIVTGCAGTPTAVPTVTSSATATPISATESPTVSPSATPSATASNVLRSDGGFLVRDPASGFAPDFFIRSEVSPRALATIRRAAAPSVSPDGTRIAYWRTAADAQPPATLVIYDLHSGTERDLLTLPDEGGGPSVWSPDGSALAIAVASKDRFAEGVDSGPKYVALRIIDAGGGTARELARITNGLFWAPLAYDRARGMVAVVEGGPGGFAVNYTLVRQDGSVSRASAGDRVLVFDVAASSDAQYVVTRSLEGDVIRFWPLADPEAARELRPASGERFWSAVWRPGTHDIATSVGPIDQTAARTGSRFELRDIGSNSARTVARGLPAMNSRFRYDGTAVLLSEAIITSPTPAPRRMLDLASGVSATVDLPEPLIAASVRIP